MAITIDWKIGVEIELLAPRGSSRRALAEALAVGGSVAPFFHPQSEPSLVPGVPVFDNLTLGFEARDSAGLVVARLVDDLTLQDDLERERPPVAGWFRIVSDDMRLLHLVRRTGRADLGAGEALAPIAALFGVEVEALPGGIFRVTDEALAPIAIGMPLPGERERPCEIVSPPFERDHEAHLEALLTPARAMGFTLARESATHLHFDASELRCARTVQRLVRFLRTWGASLKTLVGANPACRRLGAWPDALDEVVESAGFAEHAWPAARDMLQGIGLSKYCDYNLKNLVHEIADKHTVEIRVLPGLADARPIVEAAALFEGVLRHAMGDAPIAREAARGWDAREVGSMLDRLPLAPDAKRVWSERARGR